MISAWGGIFKNSQGLHVGSFCCHLGYKTTLMVELNVALFALEIVMGRNWKHIWLVPDSLLIVQAFSN